MRPAELDAWVQRVGERTAAGHQNEDSLIELKSVWEPPDDAAWKIAGHANAARGEPVLWIIGLSPKGQVVPCEHNELADWWPQVVKHFDGPAPVLRHDIVVELEGGNVIALLFETDEAPYVIKGRKEASHSVPFREGTRTVHARRPHLIRLLAPTVKMPTIELLYARFRSLGEVERKGAQAFHPWHFGARLYVVPAAGMVHFPAHRQYVRLAAGNFLTGGRPRVSGDSGTAAGDAAVSVMKPSWLHLHLEGRFFGDKPPWDDAHRVLGDLLVHVEGFATPARFPFVMAWAFLVLAVAFIALLVRGLRPKR